MSNINVLAKILNLREKFSDISFGVDDIVGVQERTWNASISNSLFTAESFSVQTNIHLIDGTSVATDDFCDSVLGVLKQYGREKPLPVVHEIVYDNRYKSQTHSWVADFKQK